MTGHIRLAPEPDGDGERRAAAAPAGGAVAREGPGGAAAREAAGGATAREAPVRVLVAAEHPLMRRGLCQLLEVEAGLQVSALAEGGSSVPALVAAESPDVVVLDRSMSGASRIATIAELRRRAPRTQVVVLSSGDPPLFAAQALSSGAAGLVAKDRADEELPPAIAAAASGERYVSPLLAAALETAREAPAPGRLTPRETEVLTLIAHGHTSVEIARKLNLSPRTIETHRAHIHSKLGLQTRAELVRYALRSGLLGVRDGTGWRRRDGAG